MPIKVAGRYKKGMVRRPKPVMVVEDEPAVLKVITLVLSDAGYRIEALAVA